MKVSKVVFLIFILLPVCLFSQYSNEAYLTIKSNANDVEILVNGIRKGNVTTNKNLILELKPGRYSIKAVKTGYEPQIKPINLEAGAVNDLLFEFENPLEPIGSKAFDKNLGGVEYGNVTVVVKKEGIPVSAKVVVKEKFIGYAPIKISQLNVGEHYIKVSYEDYDKSVKVIINKGVNPNLEIELMTKSKIEIDTKSSGTTMVSPKNVTSFPIRLSVDKGTYAFKFENSKYRSAEKIINIDGESEYTIEVNLSNTLPKVYDREVGRSRKKLKSRRDMLKPETKKAYYYTRQWNQVWGLTALLGVSGFLGGGIPSEENGEKGWQSDRATGVGIGCAVTGFVLGLLIPGNRRSKTVPDQANISYNKSRKPDIDLANENKSIKAYNNETDRLILEKQIQKYSEYAIKVTKQ